MTAVKDPPLTYGFPKFYAHMARICQRPIEESPYMQRRKEEWIERWGRWPLDPPEAAPRLDL